MSDGNGNVVSVKILPVEGDPPKGKLADAEVVFGAECGPFEGLRLIGFGVWERRGGGKSVTFPARQYEINGTRRSFMLLRSVSGDDGAYEAIRQTILDAYTRIEKAAN